MGAYVLFLTLVMTHSPAADRPKCESSIRSMVWPRDWRAAKECEKVEMCTCGAFRCGWKTVSIPMWVLAKSPKPAACDLQLSVQRPSLDRLDGPAPRQLLLHLPRP